MKRGRERGSAAGYKKAVAYAMRIHRLGKRYRAEVPPSKRGYDRWIAFLQKNAPDLARAALMAKIAPRP